MTSELEGPGPAIDDGSKGDISHKKSKLDHDEKLTPLDIVRQIPLTYVKKTLGSTRWNAESSYRKLGALMRQEEGHLTTHPNTFASPTDEGEAHAVADLETRKCDANSVPRRVFEKRRDEVFKKNKIVDPRSAALQGAALYICSDKPLSPEDILDRRNLVF